VKIVSIDLGIDPKSLGAVVLKDDELRALPVPSDPRLVAFHKGWQDNSVVAELATASAACLAELVVRHDPDVVVIDGAQGLARVGRTSRRAEDFLRTSGRTASEHAACRNGFSWPALVRLSVSLFATLRAAGYSLDREHHSMPDLSKGRWALEVFPNASWCAFGCDADDTAQLRSLSLRRSLDWGVLANEHQGDAAVGALTVLAAQEMRAVRVGLPAFDDEGRIREGFIYCPNPSISWRATA